MLHRSMPFMCNSVSPINAIAQGAKLLTGRISDNNVCGLNNYNVVSVRLALVFALYVSDSSPGLGFWSLGQLGPNRQPEP